ncbi:hypothetical protein JCM11251_007160 [Rhodosporidiobolus azoricus]
MLPVPPLHNLVRPYTLSSSCLESDIPVRFEHSSFASNGPRNATGRRGESEESAEEGEFRSLPYSSPPSLLFPSPSSQPLQFNYTPPSRSWSLRCFPSPKRTESRRPAPPPALPQPRPRARSGEEEPAAEEEEEEAREEELLLLQKKPKKRPSYTLDLTLLVSKKKVHKSAVVRNRCKRRVWEAVRLVVERGARGARGEGVGEGAAGSVSFVEGEREKKRETGPRKWLLPGYHYILTLSSLDIYRATPLPQLVDELGKGLKEVKRKAENATLSLRLSQISDSFALSSSPPFSSPDSPTSPPPTSSPLSTSAKLAPFLARADEAREDVVADPEEEKALRRVRERAEGQKSWDESVVGQEEEEVEVL